MAWKSPVTLVTVALLGAVAIEPVVSSSTGAGSFVVTVPPPSPVPPTTPSGLPSGETSTASRLWLGSTSSGIVFGTSRGGRMAFAASGAGPALPGRLTRTSVLGFGGSGFATGGGGASAGAGSTAVWQDLAGFRVFGGAS